MPRGQIKATGYCFSSHVRENFLEAMEIPLLAGRTLGAQDDARAPEVIVINQAFADKFFRNQNPLGKRFSFDQKQPDEMEIGGLAKDAKYSSQREGIPPTVYIPCDTKAECDRGDCAVIETYLSSAPVDIGAQILEAGVTH